MKIKIERPDKGEAMDIFSKSVSTELPIHEESCPSAGNRQAAVHRMITDTVEEMYRLDDDNRFLEVTYANADREVLYFKDFASGAMIESVVRRAKQLALKRYIRTGEKGIKIDDLPGAVRAEFKENEDLPNTTNPDDWAKIAGKKGERIVPIKPLAGESKPLRSRRRGLRGEGARRSGSTGGGAQPAHDGHPRRRGDRDSRPVRNRGPRGPRVGGPDREPGPALRARMGEVPRVLHRPDAGHEVPPRAHDGDPSRPHQHRPGRQRRGHFPRPGPAGVPGLQTRVARRSS